MPASPLHIVEALLFYLPERQIVVTSVRRVFQFPGRRTKCYNSSQYIPTSMSKQAEVHSAIVAGVVPYRVFDHQGIIRREEWLVRGEL